MNRRAARRTLAAAEALHRPHRLDTRFWRKEFLHRALPLGLQIVAFRPGAIDTLGSQLGRRHGGVFGELALPFEQRGELVVDLFLAFGVEEFLFAQGPFVERDGIAFLPVLALCWRNIFGRIVLRVAAATKGFGFDQNRAIARAGAFDSFPGGGVDGNNIVAIDDVARDALVFGSVGEIFERHLATHGR